MSAGKTSTRHPYAATEHRVIDSPAYADLTFSARSLLLLVTRQLTKDNNGSLQATFSYLSRFGFDSQRTLSRGIQELIAHGMIYRTRLGGYQQGPSKYAVTWLPIARKDGLFLSGFKPYAWREWQPVTEKTPPAKMPPSSGKNGIRTVSAHAKNTVDTPRKNEDIELMPCRAGESDRLQSYLAKLAEAGKGNGHHTGRVRERLTLIDCERKAA